MRWQIADIALSLGILVGSCFISQWYAERRLWVYLTGALLLAVTCVGAVVTSSMGLCCRRKFSKTASHGASVWCALAIAAAAIVAVAAPFGCERKVCRADPYYCAYNDDDFYPPYYGYPIQHKWHKGGDSDDDYFKDKCSNDYCRYYGVHPNDGDRCLNEGYQNCGFKYGTPFDTAFGSKSQHWRAFDHAQDCNKHYVTSALLAKLPLLAAALLIMGIRLGVAYSTQLTISAKERLETLAELAQVVHDSQPHTESQYRAPLLTDDDSIAVASLSTTV